MQYIIYLFSLLGLNYSNKLASYEEEDLSILQKVYNIPVAGISLLILRKSQETLHIHKVIWIKPSQDIQNEFGILAKSS